MKKVISMRVGITDHLQRCIWVFLPIFVVGETYTDMAF